MRRTGWVGLVSAIAALPAGSGGDAEPGRAKQTRRQPAPAAVVDRNPPTRWPAGTASGAMKRRQDATACGVMTRTLRGISSPLERRSFADACRARANTSCPPAEPAVMKEHK